MVFNLAQLIKFCSTKTHPAAETQSLGLPAYAQLAQVFAEPPRQLYRDPGLTVINRDSSIWTALSGPKAPSRLPGLCKNQYQRVPLSATQLNRRAVRW